MKAQKILACILLLTMFTLPLTGCSEEGAQNQTLTASKTSEVSSYIQESSEILPAEDVQIETPYGNLSYPYGFEEIVTWENKKDDTVDRYIFYAVVDDETIEVYDLTFAKQVLEGEESLLGKIQDASGSMVYVYFSAEDEIVNDGMTEDQKNTVYAAQETVNDIISSLNDIPEFTPSEN